MNDPLRPFRKGRGERGRPARSVWRPAEHIFARCRSHRATRCGSKVQRQTVENGGGVRRETALTTTVALPHHSDPWPRQTNSNRCLWSKGPPYGENPNQALSQCVAVSRSDKIVKRAGRPRPFFASLHLCSANSKNASFLAKFSEPSFRMTNERFSMTNFQFRRSGLVAALPRRVFALILANQGMSHSSLVTFRADG